MPEGWVNEIGFIYWRRLAMRWRHVRLMFRRPACGGCAAAGGTGAAPILTCEVMVGTVWACYLPWEVNPEEKRSMHDLVIRNGSIVDGTGAPARPGDLAIDGGTITEIGGGIGRGHREIDADGRVVTPGFVDAHTHYDGQVVWDPELAPSSWHGVPTVVLVTEESGSLPPAPTSGTS